MPAAPGAPRILVLHGLEGTLRSHYARGILQQARRAGWGADLLLFRGCGTEMNHTLRFYHSGETGDLDWAIGRIVGEFPDSPLFLVGYSLGGNVLLKWLGERCDRVPPLTRAAAAVSVPYDLAAGSAYIHRGFSRVYERHFLRTLKIKALRKLARFPGGVDQRRIRKADTIVDFDEAFTAPVHGFLDAADYYRQSSAIGFLKEIRLPTLLVSAVDDPFLPPDRLREAGVLAEANSALQLEFSPRGGHVGFVTGANPFRPRYYSEERIMAFFRSHLTSATSGMEPPSN